MYCNVLYADVYIFLAHDNYMVGRKCLSVMNNDNYNGLKDLWSQCPLLEAIICCNKFKTLIKPTSLSAF